MSYLLLICIIQYTCQNYFFFTHDSLEKMISHGNVISQICISSVSSINHFRSIITEAKEELIKNICNSREKTLRAESQELLGRMRKKVELLKEDKVDIQTELTDNTTNIITIIETVRSLGNIVDADKLKVNLVAIRTTFIDLNFSIFFRIILDTYRGAG